MGLNYGNEGVKAQYKKKFSPKYLRNSNPDINFANKFETTMNLTEVKIQY